LAAEQIAAHDANLVEGQCTLDPMRLDEVCEALRAAVDC